MGITELALNKLRDDELLEVFYSNPDAILSYLTEPQYFRTLSSLISETMISKGLCNEDTDIAETKKILRNLLGKVNPVNANNDSVRKRLDRWMKNESSRIEYFEDAIEICYAINLNLEQTNTFLNKAGFCSLGVRNAKHAIHYYCFLNGRSLDDFNKLYGQYLDAHYDKTESASDKNAELDNETSSTTVVMLKHLKSNWESDEQFLNSFLIPYKSRFINYSKRALKDYYRVKSIFTATVSVNLAEKDSYVSEMAKTNYPLQYNLRSKLRNYDYDHATQEVSDLLKKALNNLKYPTIPHTDSADTNGEIMRETRDTLYNIRNAVFDIEDPKSLEEISSFLNNVIKIEGAYKAILPNLKSLDNRIKNTKKGLNKQFSTITEDFPTPKNISAYEKSLEIGDKNLILRKLTILIHFFVFCYEYAICNFQPMKNYPDLKMIFEELSFDSFVEITNHALNLNCLPPLYPPNKFDFLILINIKKITEFDLSDPDEPLAYFDEILSLIFDVSPEE